MSYSYVDILNPYTLPPDAFYPDDVAPDSNKIVPRIPLPSSATVPLLGRVVQIPTMPDEGHGSQAPSETASIANPAELPINELANQACEINDFIQDSGLDAMAAEKTPSSLNSIKNLGPTALSLVLGGIDIHEGYKTAQNAYKTGDSTSFKESILRTAKGFFETTNNTISAVHDILQAGSPQSLTKLCTQSLGLVSTVGVSGAAGAFLAISTIQLTEVISTMKSITPELKDPDTDVGFQALTKKLCINYQDKATVLKDLIKKPSSFKKLQNFLGNALLAKRLDPQLLNAIRNPTDESIEALTLPSSLNQLESNFAALRITITPPGFSGLNQANQIKFNQILKHLYAEALELKKEQKENIFTRVFGKEALNALKAAINNPTDDIKKTTAVAKALDGIKSSLIKSIFKMLGALLVSAAVILAYISTGGAFFFVEVGIALLISSIALGIDGYKLYKSFKSKSITKKDKALTAISTFLIFSLTVAGVVLAKLVKSKIATIALSASWAFAIAYTIYICFRKEAEDNTAAPINNLNITPEEPPSEEDLVEEPLPLPEPIVDSALGATLASLSNDSTESSHEPSFNEELPIHILIDNSAASASEKSSSDIKKTAHLFLDEINQGVIRNISESTIFVKKIIQDSVFEATKLKSNLSP